jgi:hypothetical protein
LRVCPAQLATEVPKEDWEADKGDPANRAPAVSLVVCSLATIYPLAAGEPTINLLTLLEQIPSVEATAIGAAVNTAARARRCRAWANPGHANLRDHCGPVSAGFEGRLYPLKGLPEPAELYAA